MISLRRHVLTLVAVFLALAVGVVLGATSASTGLRDALVDSKDTTAGELDRKTADLESARGDVRRLEGMADTLSPAVLPGLLDRRPVLLVVAPGASADDVAAVTDGIREAGGQDAGTLTLTDKVLDPAADGEVQSLVANFPIGQAPAADAEVGTQLGTALGRAAELRPDDAKPHIDDHARDTVLTTLSDSGFVRYDKGTLRPGQLTLLVTSPEAGEEGATGSRIAAVARALDAEGAGTVVASQLGAGARGDAVSTLRAGESGGVSTVDDVATRQGHLAAVLALAEQLRHGEGAYGMRPDATAALPAPR